MGVADASSVMVAVASANSDWATPADGWAGAAASGSAGGNCASGPCPWDAGGAGDTGGGGTGIVPDAATGPRRRTGGFGKVKGPKDSMHWMQ